jgi:hypothetical protein
MIAENNEVPICAEHSLKITVCTPCQVIIGEYFDTMPKKVPHAWNRELETLADYHFRERLAFEDDQARLHRWAVMNVYVDPLENVEVPF